MLRRCLAALPALFLILGAAPAARATTTVLNVTKRGTSQSEAAVAASPLDANNVVIVSNVQRGYGITVGVSHDGGMTWARSIVGDDDRFGIACCDPSISWDDQGNLFLAWLGFTTKSFPTVVPILMSTDAGDSWARLVQIKPPKPRRGASSAAVPLVRSAGADARDEEEERGGFIDQPTITTGPHALWANWNNDGQMQAVGARVLGLGEVAAFKPVRDIPDSRNCTFGDIVVGPGGAVANVCQKDRPHESPTTSVLRFTVDADGLKPGRFGRGRVAAHTDVSLFEPIRPQRSRTVDAEAGLAWILHGPDRGRLVLLFTDEKPDQSDDTNVYVKLSDDAGGTWGPRIGVATDIRSQFLPRIATDPATGDLVTGWHDASLDPGSGPYDTDGVANTDAMYALAFSADGGASWTAPQMVSEAASNAAASRNLIEYGDYTGLAFTFGIAHPAWADNSNSTGDNPDGTLHAFDVYTAAVAEN
ncbi:MAG: sialidase family protein [Actinomycetota bacterium]